MLCANVVLLAHAVVPHHHHDGTACFTTPIEEEQDHCCDHDTAKPHEKHDANTADDCCILNDILAIVPDNYRQENFAFDFKCNENTNLYFSVILTSDSYDEPLGYLKAIRQQSYFPSLSKTFLAHSHGLRAPPCC